MVRSRILRIKKKYHCLQGCGLFNQTNPIQTIFNHCLKPSSVLFKANLQSYSVDEFINAILRWHFFLIVATASSHPHHFCWTVDSLTSPCEQGQNDYEKKPFGFGKNRRENRDSMWMQLWNSSFRVIIAIIKKNWKNCHF